MKWTYVQVVTLSHLLYGLVSRIRSIVLTVAKALLSLIKVQFIPPPMEAFGGVSSKEQSG